MLPVGKLASMFLAASGGQPTPACVCGHPRAAHRDGVYGCRLTDGEGRRCACSHYEATARPAARERHVIRNAR